MCGVLLFTLLAVPGVDVEAKPLAGPEITGTLVSLSADTLVVKTAQGEKSLGVRELQSVGRPGKTPESVERAKVWVDLIDGSELTGNKYVAAAGKATFTLLGGATVEIPTRSIRSVRLHEKPTDATLQKEWSEIVEGKPAGDVLIIRKVSVVKVEGDDKTTEKTQVALDSLEGVLKDVTPDLVQFVFDGDTLDVKREKIEGFVYYHAVDRELPDAACRVSDASGSAWQAKSVTLAGEQLEIVGVAGVKVSLPLARFVKLDYSAGNTVFLSDLKPDSAEFRHPLDDRFTSGRLAKFYQPRDNRGLEADSRLRLEGDTRDHRGLALHSRTQLVYRLPAKAQWFESLAELDGAVPDHCVVKLVISGDNKPLLTETITGVDKARSLKVDVSGVRRLGILVDVVSDRTSSQLNLIEARITK